MKTAAYYFLRGEDSHWRACCLLYHDYQKRKKGAYQAFQGELFRRKRNITEAHLRFMMGAYLTYLDLCKEVGAFQIAPLRRQLPYTYFARAGQSWRTQDLTARDVLYVLQQAASGEVKNAAQVQDALVMEAVTNGDTSGELNGRQWVGREIYPVMLRFTETPPVDVPGELVYHAQEFVRLSKDWLNGDAY